MPPGVRPRRLLRFRWRGTPGAGDENGWPSAEGLDRAVGQRRAPILGAGVLIVLIRFSRPGRTRPGVAGDQHWRGAAEEKRAAGTGFILSPTTPARLRGVLS